MKMNTKGVALVLGRTLHLYGVAPELLLENEKWLAHEMVHIK